MSSQKAIEVVIFDWGGTLTPWADIDVLDSWRAYSRVVRPDDAESLAQTLAKAEVARWAEQRRTAGHAGTGRLDQLLSEHGIDTESEVHRYALAAYDQWWTPYTLSDPQAAPLMLALRERGLRIGVLSNTQWPVGVHDAVLVRDGLQHLIDGAVYTSELRVGKPHPDAFRAALDSVGVESPASAVFVGDRPYDDVHGAQMFGMRAILLAHGGIAASELVAVETEPDAVVSELADVLGVIDSWL